MSLSTIFSHMSSCIGPENVIHTRVCPQQQLRDSLVQVMRTERVGAKIAVVVPQIVNEGENAELRKNIVSG
jgi:hypothetical protein